jgi:hypothetical protein
MTDKELAYLQLAIYGHVPDPGWDWHSDADDVVVCATKTAEDGVVDVSMRGTEDRIDLIFDLDVRPVNVPPFGRLHSGFFNSLEWTWDDLQKEINGRPWRISGHSLGAARATDITCLAIRDKNPPLIRICWGEPASGFAEQVEYLKPVPARSYRNSKSRGSRLHDPITDVPLVMPNFEFYHACTFTDISAPPVGKPIYDFFAWHDSHLYYQGTPSILLPTSGLMNP